jgi:hypothetical protein
MNIEIHHKVKYASWDIHIAVSIEIRVSDHLAGNIKGVSIHSVLLQNFGENWDGTVDWVGDNQEEGVRSVLRAGLSEGSDDRRVNAEEVVAGHTLFCDNRQVNAEEIIAGHNDTLFSIVS